MRRKVDIIDDCDDCSYRWMYLGVDICCGLLNRTPINLEELDKEGEGIPNWCPLEDAPEE